MLRSPREGEKSKMYMPKHNTEEEDIEIVKNTGMTAVPPVAVILDKGSNKRHKTASECREYNPKDSY